MSKLIEVKFNSVEDFVRKQLDLLNLEKDAEITESRKLQENVSSKQLQEKGVCLINLSVQNLRSGLYGRSIVTFGSKITGKELPSTNLSSGMIFQIGDVKFFTLLTESLTPQVILLVYSPTAHHY